MATGVPARPPEKRRSPRRGASPSMGSKGERQDGLAGVGVNRVPPGFARPRDGASDPLLAGLQRVPANPVDVRRDEPVAASLGRSTVRRRRRSCAVPFWDLMQSAGCRARPPSSGRPASSAVAVKRHRRDPPASRSPCCREPEAPNRLKAGGCLLTPTPTEHPVGFPSFRMERRECLPGEGLPPSMAGGASGAGAWPQPPAAPAFVSREPEPALMRSHEDHATG